MAKRLTSRLKASFTFGMAVVVALTLIPWSPAGAREETVGSTDDSVSARHAEDHILVRYQPVSFAARSLGLESEDVGHGWIRANVPDGWNAEGWALEVQSFDGVEGAEVDPVFRAMASPPFMANDPLFVGAANNPAKQWHLHAAGVVEAWESTVGSGVRVAVVDSGVSSGTDGFCNSFVAEYDAVTETTGSGAAADPDGHGSHVAGTIAQCSGNSHLGAGMAPEALIMPIDVFDGDEATGSDIAQGIDWAIANGAKVINLSFGNPDVSSSVIDEAIARAASANIVLIAASGNTPTDVFYPASHPDVISVGSVTFAGAVASYSARGPSLELVGPGGDNAGGIWQDTAGGYVGLFGTSMAAAHVSGSSALLRARFPSASAGQVRASLICGARDIGPAGWDQTSGYGVVDAGAAIDQLEFMVQSHNSNCSSGSPSAGDGVGLVQSSSGIWRLYTSGGLLTKTFYYGVPHDYAFSGDWDCDGIDTPGLYRRSDGYVYLRNSNTQGFADVSYFFGVPNDVPLAGDFDGDGCDTVSIYRPSEARFYIINDIGSKDAGLGSADYSFLYGVPGDAPFVGDWNNNGVDTPGLRRSADGFVYLRNTNTQGIADKAFFYGINGDVVFAGDWNEDGVDSIGLYRPSPYGQVFLRNQNSTGIADMSFTVGPGFQPVSGDFE